EAHDVGSRGRQPCFRPDSYEARIPMDRRCDIVVAIATRANRPPPVRACLHSDGRCSTFLMVAAARRVLAHAPPVPTFSRDSGRTEGGDHGSFASDLHLVFCCDADSGCGGRGGFQRLEVGGQEDCAPAWTAEADKLAQDVGIELAVFAAATE